MVSMNTCHHCKNFFGLTETDQAFYQKIEVPNPTFCPQCREQRRLAFRNERSLYKRTCDSCDKNILSTYNPKNPFKQLRTCVKNLFFYKLFKFLSLLILALAYQKVFCCGAFLGNRRICLLPCWANDPGIRSNSCLKVARVFR